MVLGIARGGLVVADAVAKALSATLDVVIARKLRAPYQPELGIGAVVDGDRTVLNEEVVRSVGASQDYLNREIAYQKGEVERRLRFYRRGHPARLVAAAPVAARDSAEMLKAFADEVVCLHTPISFYAVGAWYENFDQLSDDEAAAILRRNWSAWPLAA